MKNFTTTTTTIKLIVDDSHDGGYDNMTKPMN